MSPHASQAGAGGLHALNLVLERATQERDRLAAELRRCEEQLARAREQGLQLVEYRSEYTQRWSMRLGHGSSIEIVHCWHSFRQRLDEALQQQQRQIEHADRSTGEMRQRLLQAELRVAAIAKLIERRRAELVRTQSRHEQRQTDETAQRVALQTGRGRQFTLS